MERMCYSYSALCECADMVKSFDWNVNKKAEHFSKCFAVKEVFEFCLRKTNCIIFEPYFSPWELYLKAVDRNESKNELDRNLRNCYRFLCNELNSILRMMNNGEVDYTD